MEEASQKTAALSQLSYVLLCSALPAHLLVPRRKKADARELGIHQNLINVVYSYQ